MLPAVHYNNNLHFHLFKFHMRTHIIKIHHRDTGINLPPCGEPPLPSNDMFEALSSTVSILQREVRYLYFYNCYYSCITNRFSNRVSNRVFIVHLLTTDTVYSICKLTVNQQSTWPMHPK